MAERDNRFQNPVTDRIQDAARRGVLSHALLLTGSGPLFETARFAAAAMECEAEGRQPCGVCGVCRKVLADIHPDVITVRDPDHKRISVDIIREMRADAWIRPNEGRRKVYLFPDCTLLSEQDQNVLLKIVEEGPPYAAFIFCAENSAVVLQTLRSRCVELKLQSSKTSAAGETAESAEVLCRALLQQRHGAVAEAAVRLEKQKTDRAALAAILAHSIVLCTEALKLQYGQDCSEWEIAAKLAKTLTKTQIMSTIEVLQTYHGACVFNIGVGHTLGALAVELEGIL